MTGGILDEEDATGGEEEESRSRSKEEQGVEVTSEEERRSKEVKSSRVRMAGGAIGTDVGDEGDEGFGEEEGEKCSEIAEKESAKCRIEAWGSGVQLAQYDE